MSKENKGIGFFERYLTIWVTLCIIAGIAIGQWIPAVPETLGKWEYANVSIPIAVLIWLMIYPMMLKVDFQSVKNVGKRPKGVFITCVTNWLIKPFTMFGIAWFFFVVFKTFIPTALADQYLAGAVPIVGFLLGIGGIAIPWATLILSVVLFVVIPLVAGIFTRILVVRRYGIDYFNTVFVNKFNKCTIIGLLLTLIILFSFQGKTILSNPLHIVLIAVPLIIQTFLIFFIAYGWAKAWKLPHNVAAPAGMIGASNFFELSVAVAISLFGVQSGAALATVVGVLVEVPVMLTLVKIANNTRKYFKN